MGDAGDGSSLASKTRAVQRNLTKLRNELNDGQVPCEVSISAIIDALERFILWAGNLGALREPKSKLSLDHRASAAPEVREQISQQLDNLMEDIDDLSSIIRGQRPNRNMVSDDESENDVDSGSDEADEPPDEAHMIMDLISDDIKTLFRIGVLVRKSAPDTRFERALRSSKFVFPESFDVDYVKAKHPKMSSKEHDWLAERLGKGITKRRQFIKYCRDHKARLAVDDVPLDIALKAEAATTLRLSSKATTLKFDTLLPELYVDVEEEEENDDTISFISTSTATSALSVLKLPRLSDISQNGEPFECPLCFTLQSTKGEAAWRSHAFGDLRPYMCTLGRSSCSSELFGDRNSWFQHELEVHRSQYTCSLCGDKSFSSQSHLRTHITNAHGPFPDHQLRALQNSGRTSQTAFKARDCPLCDDWATRLRAKATIRGDAMDEDIVVSSNRYKRHVAAHQEQLALFAIPRGIEDYENEEADSTYSEISTVQQFSDSREEPASEEIVEYNNLSSQLRPPMKLIVGDFRAASRLRQEINPMNISLAEQDVAGEFLEVEWSKNGSPQNPSVPSHTINSLTRGKTKLYQMMLTYKSLLGQMIRKFRGH
ncbi:hypothetical protein PT974_11120 [Cladobotryum mycophilum]|uniref:C2H2-type domain-containing protein n=1 Tax=Cladobotryum mycophilum TaxID=491253 RepID=A0ABR0S5B7_9HYPO